MSTSVLHNFKKNNLNFDPFPYLVNDNPLVADLYEDLQQTFPKMERFLSGGLKQNNNQAIRIPASMVIGNPEFSKNWQNFFQYHTSQAFWKEIVAIVGEGLRLSHPDLEAKRGKSFETWQTKLRGTPGEADVELDVLFVINTPSQKTSSVRPVHVDFGEKIFAGLYYMRHPNDNSIGGDLAIYRFKNQREGFGGHYARPQDVDETNKITYQGNRFIGFVNCATSLHGVTPRLPTPFVRQYINFVATTPFKAFNIKKLSPIRRALFFMQRRNQKEKGITLGMSASKAGKNSSNY